MKIYFRPTRFTWLNDPISCQEKDREYLICFLTSQNLRSLVFYDKVWTRLLVPKDNSTFSQQIKEMIDKPNVAKCLFATPFTNLKFKPDFGEKNDEHEGHALLIKDPSQVEKLPGTNITDIKKQHQPYQITFKVLSQHKEGHGWGEEGKRLSYEESFSKYGSYIHVLEIEPLDLGIEDLPPITRLTFTFADQINPLAEGNLELTKCELYKSPILTNSVGKTFTMKIEEFKIYSNDNSISLSTNYDYVFGSLFEKKSQNNSQVPPKTPPKNNNVNSSSPNHEPQKYLVTLKGILITGGIVVGLSFLAFVFYHCKKKKKKLPPYQKF